jgi:hypothetical protein
MKTGKLLWAGALALALGAGMVQARIPVAPMDDAAKAKAEEAKVNKAAAAKKAAELLAKAQDRVVERYRNEHGKGGMPAAAATK